MVRSQLRYLYQFLHTLFRACKERWYSDHLSRGAGEERRSHIVYYDITTGQIEKVDPSGGTAAIQSAANQSNTERISYFDAAGRQVSNKTKGLVIKQITTADGVRRSKTIFRK